MMRIQIACGIRGSRLGALCSAGRSRLLASGAWLKSRGISHLSNTFEEAEAVRAWAVQDRAKRVIVPTDFFAARRTRWIFRRELGPIGVDVEVHSFAPSEYGISDWWGTTTASSISIMKF